ncbi:hypothetical protein PQR05_29750 [Paraburkholderia sediminicola]|uniref:hypothetical protein n=1 Tax=Paraburkholderia sediminicola TaxID=458836 RepID=UPI0038BC440C
MIRLAIEAIKARRRQREADARALASYRGNVPRLQGWLAEMPDMCMVLEQVKSNAGDGSARYLDGMELRDRVYAIRRADTQKRAEERARIALVAPVFVLEDAIRFGSKMILQGDQDRDRIRSYFRTLATQVAHMVEHDRTSKRVSTILLNRYIEFAARPGDGYLWTGETALMNFFHLSEEVEYAIKRSRA